MSVTSRCRKLGPLGLCPPCPRSHLSGVPSVPWAQWGRCQPQGCSLCTRTWSSCRSEREGDQSAGYSFLNTRGIDHRSFCITCPNLDSQHALGMPVASSATAERSRAEGNAAMQSRAEVMQSSALARIGEPSVPPSKGGASAPKMQPRHLAPLGSLGDMCAHSRTCKPRIVSACSKSRHVGRKSVLDRTRAAPVVQHTCGLGCNSWSKARR